jgi:hypothetical protein
MPPDDNQHGKCGRTRIRPALTDARCREAGQHHEWGDVLRDLDRLQEVVIEKDCRQMTLRTPASGLIRPLFKAVRIALPPNVRELAGDNSRDYHGNYKRSERHPRSANCGEHGERNRGV